MSKTTTPKRQKFLLLQILRAIAAILVVLFHLTGSNQITFKTAFANDFFDFGSSGVQIFFILSGFIIAYTGRNQINRGGLSAFKTYLKKRLIRIYPIYWVTITGFLLLMFLLHFSTGHQITFLNLLGTYALLPNHEMINGVSWSLSHEMYFYLLFALLIWSKKFIYPIVGILVLSIVGLFFSSELSQTHRYIDFLFSRYNLQFALGVGLVFIPWQKMSINRTIALMGILLFSIIYFIFGHFGHPQFSSTQADLIYGLITCGYILFSLFYESINPKGISPNNFFVHLGDASYVLYLIHLPILRVFHRVLNSMGNWTSLELNLLNWVFVVLVCFLSIGVHRWIEKPLLKFLKWFSFFVHYHCLIERVVWLALIVLSVHQAFPSTPPTLLTVLLCQFLLDSLWYSHTSFWVMLVSTSRKEVEKNT